jgi:hypothetical protein
MSIEFNRIPIIAQCVNSSAGISCPYTTYRTVRQRKKLIVDWLHFVLNLLMVMTGNLNKWIMIERPYSDSCLLIFSGVSYCDERLCVFTLNLPSAPLEKQKVQCLDAISIIKNVYTLYLTWWVTASSISYQIFIKTDKRAFILFFF